MARVWKEADLHTEAICSFIDNALSRRTPRTLMQGEKVIGDPATATDLRSERVASLLLEPKRMASDLVGFTAMSFRENQAQRQERQFSRLEIFGESVE